MAPEKAVTVRFKRDLGEQVLVGDFTVPPCRGPVRQRRVSGDVELAPGETLTVPPEVARVLEDGGYIEPLVGEAG